LHRRHLGAAGAPSGVTASRLSTLREIDSMGNAYVIGHITVKDAEKWDAYRSGVPATLAPWGAELVFRGSDAEVLAGQHAHTDVVVIRFPDRKVVDAWHSSAAYQALIPLRQQAAEVVLLSYEG
jgi:uncharacterized protein (DUF1330 family)